MYSPEAWHRGFSPGLLHRYGAYGIDLDKSLTPNRLCLLNLGWVVAFADVRSGTNGPGWHKSGSIFQKLNSMHDFVSCSRFLFNERYVQKDRVCAFGVTNMYPGLFRAAVLKVPLLDACNTLLDSELLMTKLNYEEFGNPQVQAQCEYIRSYSPYDNIPFGSCQSLISFGSARCLDFGHQRFGFCDRRSDSCARHLDRRARGLK